jgi:hypothetical protein
MISRVSKEPERPDVSINDPDGETGTDNSLAPGGIVEVPAAAGC